MVLVDNDVDPSPGWVERLVECADETGAAAVGPTIFHGPNADATQIHIAGGEIVISDRVLTESHYHAFCDINDVGPLTRKPVTALEYHCVLLRTSFARESGLFDEELLAFGDHESITMLAQKLGLTCYFEPASQITYLTMIPLEDYELGYWQLRWSESWNRRSVEHFAKQWDIRVDQGWPVQARLFGTRHRTRWYHGRGKPMSYAAKVIRKANSYEPTARLTRGLEERFMSRDLATEIARREKAGIGVNDTAGARALARV